MRVRSWDHFSIVRRMQPSIRPTIFTCLAVLVLCSWRVATGAFSLNDPPVTFDLKEAYFNETVTVSYYDLGVKTPYAVGDKTIPAAAPIWILITGWTANNSSPILVPGQWPIFGTLPDEDGYSDLHRISFVTVPDTYVANTWKALEDIPGNVSTTQTPAIWLDEPIVPVGSTLAGTTPLPVQKGYHRDHTIAFIQAGRCLPSLAKIYKFYKAGSSTAIGKAVVDLYPDNNNLIKFWDIVNVTVPADYVAGSIKTAAAAMALPHVSSGWIGNYPIVEKTGAGTGGGSMTPAPTTNKGDAQSNAFFAAPFVTFALILIVILA